MTKASNHRNQDFITLLPMDHDSSISSVKIDLHSGDDDSPRRSSVLFIRQFARVCMGTNSRDSQNLILN